MKMNLPNKLTMLRVIMIPFFVAAILYSEQLGKAYDSEDVFTTTRIIAGILFCAASFTDFLDGYLARKNNLVTNFGKFMDPLADKLLVCSALILLTSEQLIPSWITIIIVGREFIISGFRLVASDNGVVIAASYWGKWKTVTQMVLCIFLIFAPQLSYEGPGRIFKLVVLTIAVALTLISLCDYIWKNKSVITDGGM